MSKNSSLLEKVFLQHISPGERRRQRRLLFLSLGLGLAIALVFGVLLYLVNNQGRI